MPTEASSRAGLTMSGNGSATRETSGVVRSAASGVGTPRAAQHVLGLVLVHRQTDSVSGDEPVYASPSRSSSSGSSGSKLLTPSIDSHRLKTTSGANSVISPTAPYRSAPIPTVPDGQPAAASAFVTLRTVPRTSSRERFSGSASAPS